ncbi:HIT ZINC FINGER AND PAPA-1-LIKE DOMAIN-CONTAINING PROTEIN, partial [Salix viminalis]
ENLDNNHSFASGKGNGLQGVPWKDFSRSGLNDGKADGLRVENLFSKQTDQSEPVRKSKRAPKKRLLDGALDDGAEMMMRSGFEDEEAGSRKQRKILRVLKKNVDGLKDEGDVCAGVHGSTRFGKECKKSELGRVSEDTDYV